MIEASIKGIDLRFQSSAGLFSPDYLDQGTLAMLSCAEFQPGERVLDLGCGYGVVGIYAAKIVGAEHVVMVDINPEAVAAAKANAARNDVEGVQALESDGFANLAETGFDIILSNPPYHTDFSVPKAFIEKGFNRLKLGGRLYMVTKRKDWYKNKLISVFGGVKIWEIDDYFVFLAIKKGNSYAKRK